MNKLFVILLILAAGFSGFSCDNADSSPRALLNVILVDSPAAWDSVFVEIEGVDVEVMAGGRQTDIQKFFLEYKSGDKRIKVSELVGGEALLLGRNELPVGTLIKATVRLGRNHSMFFNQNRFTLPLADPDQLEIQLETDINLEAGISYDLILDLDLEKSILLKTASPPSYEISPTFYALSGVGQGSIQGTVAPTGLNPAIYLINEEDSISTHTNTSGAFLIRIREGNYSIYIDPKDETYADTAFSVKVSQREVTNLDRITLSLKR